MFFANILSTIALALLLPAALALPLELNGVEEK